MRATAAEVLVALFGLSSSLVVVVLVLLLLLPMSRPVAVLALAATAAAAAVVGAFFASVRGDGDECRVLAQNHRKPFPAANGERQAHSSIFGLRTVLFASPHRGPSDACEHVKTCRCFDSFSVRAPVPDLPHPTSSAYFASQELHYGGWVAPKIYFMGFAGVIRVGGVRIAGLTGIWNNR